MIESPQTPNPKWDIARVSNCPITEEEYLSINGASRQGYRR